MMVHWLVWRGLGVPLTTKVGFVPQRDEVCCRDKSGGGWGANFFFWGGGRWAWGDDGYGGHERVIPAAGCQKLEPQRGANCKLRQGVNGSKLFQGCKERK